MCVNYCGELKELPCSVISLKTPLLPHSHFTHTIQNNVKQQQESNGCEWNNVIQQNMMRNKGKGEWCCVFQQNDKQMTCSTKGRMKQHTHICVVHFRQKCSIKTQQILDGDREKNGINQIATSATRDLL